MNIDLTPIFEAAIALLAAVVTCKVLPWLQAKLGDQKQRTLLATVRTLVYAAEQLYGAGAGEEKLKYVREELLVRGFAVDYAAIEAAVKELSLHLTGWTGEAETTETDPEAVG